MFSNDDVLRARASRAVDPRSVSALLYENAVIEESGVAAADAGRAWRHVHTDDGPFGAIGAFRFM